MKSRYFVSVPASSGNIGPGYDVLGFALTLRNEMSLRVLSPNPGDPVIKLKGEGANSLSAGKSNLAYRAFLIPFKALNRRPPKVEMQFLNRIPLSRGLGSSSTAALLGLLGANAVLKNRFKPSQILFWATQLEGHPDNIAPALLGGVQAAAQTPTTILTAALPIPKLKMAVAIPQFELSTKKARKVLPKKIEMGSAVFNLSAVALLPEAFRRHPEWLRFILNDQLHEPYRAKLIPGFYQVKKAALNAGAWGMTLSGAGPTLLSFVSSQKANRVMASMVKAFSRAGIKSHGKILNVDTKGAIVR